MRLSLMFSTLAFAVSGCLALTAHDGPWACGSNAECSNGDVCRPLESGPICAAPDFCDVDQDCQTGSSFGTWYSGAGWSCSSSHCVTPSCSDDATCSPYECGVSGHCGSTCASDADCDSAFGCSRGVCTTRSCQGDADCGAYICNQGVCLTNCFDATSCSANNVCIASGCTAPKPCTTGSHGECGGFACVNGGCATDCSKSACDPGLACSNAQACECSTTPGACGAYVCRDLACLTKCTSDADCESGLFCTPGGTCASCTGTPVACGSLTTNCTGTDGCYDGSQICTGGSFSCSIYSGNVVACDNNPDCSWENSFSQCSGSGECSKQPLGACSSAGCTVGTECVGMPTPCSEFSTYAQCAASQGCVAK